MEINRDGDGFLLSLDDWSEEVMYEMAEIDGFEISDEIKTYIFKAREMFNENGTVPAVRDFAKASTTITGVKDIKSLVQFEESVVPITPVGEGIVYAKEFTQLEQVGIYSVGYTIGSSVNIVINAFKN